MSAESLTQVPVESHDRRKWLALALIVTAQLWSCSTWRS